MKPTFAIIAMLLLASCGGDDGAPPTLPTAPTPTPTPTPTPAPRPVAGVTKEATVAAFVSPWALAVLPDSVSDIEGAVVEPASVSAYGVDRAGVRGGDVVLVTGAGPIGMLSAMYASAIGASTVVIAEPNPRRAELARKMDIGPVIDPTSGELEAFLADATRGLGVDIGIECSGTTAGLGACVANSRPRGTVVQTGLHTKPATLDAMGLSERDITLVGSWCYLITDWPRIIRLIASGKYPVGKVVTANIGLADVVTKGFDVLVDPMGDQLKVLVQPELAAVSA